MNDLSLKLIVVSLLVFLPIGLHSAQDKEFKKWLNQYKKEFKTYVDEHDKEFATFLKENWVETDVKPEQKRDSKPKPKTPPKPAPKIKPKPPVVIELPPEPKPDPVKPKHKEPDLTKPSKPEPPKGETKLPVKPEPTPVAKPKTPFHYVNAGDNSTKITMLGNVLTMPKLAVSSLRLDKISSDSISDAWMAMAKQPFKDQVTALEKAANDLSLDDWGKALLTHQYLKSNQQLNKTDLQLYAWFYLVKQGFDTRVAFYDKQVYLMLKVSQKLFGQKYFTLKSGKYYFVDLEEKRPIQVGRVYTYDKQHSSANDAINIDLSVAPLTAKANKQRHLSTRIKNIDVQVNTPYHADYVEFLDHYPQLSMEYYFQAELPQSTRDSLLSQLKPYVQRASEEAALNFLLRFVQTSLEYQTDQQQFNYENYLFAGETLHYPYADCEDRAVLYAYLVKNLLGNNVVGLQYDGHIATAVEIKEQIAGDTFVINGRNYIVADPTFINANIGQTMTGFEKQSPQIIRF